MAKCKKVIRICELSFLKILTKGGCDADEGYHRFRLMTGLPADAELVDTRRHEGRFEFTYESDNFPCDITVDV